MVELVKEAELLAIRDGTYTIYVFRIIETNEYVMCTKLPNWNVPEINIGEKGFLQYQMVKAGDSYTTPEGEVINYKYTNIYFMNFINKPDIIRNKEIII